MNRCSHVWIDGFVDFGLGYTNKSTINDILRMRNTTILSLDPKFHHPEHCSICFLERHTKRDGKPGYLKYWQKELRINRELVSSYYRQLRESETPMNYMDYVRFRSEQAEITGEPFDYKANVPNS